MDPMADRLLRAYPEGQRRHIYPASKADALEALERLREVIVGMGDFDRFPEGPNGVVLYALVRAQADTCPDVGDFNDLCQGTELLFGVARRALEDDIRESSMPGRGDASAR